MIDERPDQTKKYFLFGAMLIGILAVAGLVWAIFAVPDTNQGMESDLGFSDENDPNVGPADAKVVVRIFSDFQCPACKVAERPLRDIMKQYADRVRFVWNDFPLSMHPNSQPAAVAARCAEEQGKFWEYSAALFDKQEEWSVSQAPSDLFKSYAQDLGLDKDAYAACLTVQRPLAKIKDDLAEGASNKVGATPTFFIGQKRITGNLTEDIWRSDLDAALKQR